MERIQEHGFERVVVAVESCIRTRSASTLSGLVGNAFSPLGATVGLIVLVGEFVD